MPLTLLCRRNRSVGDGRDIQGLASFKPACGIRGRPKYIARKYGRLGPGRVQDKCGESVLSDNLIAVSIAQSINLLLVEQVFQLLLQILPVHVPRSSLAAFGLISPFTLLFFALPLMPFAIFCFPRFSFLLLSTVGSALVAVFFFFSAPRLFCWYLSRDSEESENP